MRKTRVVRDCRSEPSVGRKAIGIVIKVKLWNFRPLAVKLTAKSDISIDYGPSATDRLVAASSNWFLPVVAHGK